MPPTRRGPGSEDGYILIGVLFLLALFIIAMAVAAPKIAADIQRDREVETMQRGKQYIRAIQLYYKKFNAYPPNVDALVKTNEIRFLRKRYIDPITGKDDWKPIPMGMNKAPLAMGFFGQPLGGVGGMGAMPMPGTGPGGLSGGMGNPTVGGGLTGEIGGQSPTGGIFGNNPTPPTSSSGSGSGTGPGAGTGTGTDQSGNGSGPTDANGNPIQSGATFGGAGIVGFSPASPKASILVYKKKTHYNEWEFTYTPLMDQQMMGGGNIGAGGGQPLNGQPPGVLPGPGNGTGLNPVGPGQGSNPMPPTPSPTPQPPQ
ncbi:MAG TPA: hypothetical protein VKB38_21440 [Terracidiphilus sp.]|nr:hypothetical protein [Terracidiphilus sp.]